MLSRRLPACKKQKFNGSITYIGHVWAHWRRANVLASSSTQRAVDSAPAEACRNTCLALAALCSLPPSRMSPRLRYKSLAKLVSLAAEWIQSGVRRRQFITEQQTLVHGISTMHTHTRTHTHTLPAGACLTRRHLHHCRESTVHAVTKIIVEWYLRV